MELTPVQRLVTFALIVLVLAGLGVYLFLPKSSDGAAAAGRPRSTPSAGRGGPGSVRPTPVPSSTPATPPPASPPASKVTDIYNWLPFTSSGLASAAKTATTFAADYGTFSYQQSTSGYLAPMKPLMSSQLADLIGRAYSVPGVVAQRTAAKQVSVGSAVVKSLRGYGSSSLTFVVTLTEKLTTTKGRSEQSTGYAITVTGSGSSWQVSNIEFASAGNQ